MALKITGLDNIMKELNELKNPNIRHDAYRKAVSEAGDIVLKDLQSEVKANPHNSKNAYKHLSVDLYEDNYHFSDVCFKAKVGISSDNWEKTRGVWFHQYGFRSHPAHDFFGRAYAKAEKEVISSIEDTLKRALGK